MRRRNQDVRCPTPRRPKDQPSHVWYLRQNWNRQVSIEASATSLRFAIIGAGRLGASLALALRTRGQSLTGFTAGSSAGLARAQAWLGVPGVPTLADLVETRPDLYVICVPDGAVAGVAAALATELGAGRGIAAGTVVAHTSGATSIAALQACAEAGTATLVFHPLQTFPEPLSASTRFAGAGVALTPGPVRPEAAGATGMRLAETLGMRPFFLVDDKRGLYHAAATVACNYLVTLEHAANELFVEAGVPERVSLSLFLPLVTATLENLATRGSVEALTGPLSRGDVATVATHLQALAADAPHLLPVYRALGEATLPLVAAKPDVSHHTLERLEKLLAASEGAPSATQGPAPAPDDKRDHAETRPQQRKDSDVSSA